MTRRIDTGGDKAVRHAATIIRQGGLVAFPTETFYGLACRFDAPEALERLAALKSRPADAPFPLIISDAEERAALTAPDPAVEPVALALAERFWPGPLTLIFDARAGLHETLIGPDGGVAMRRSSHPVASALAALVGAPITATSANRRKQAPPSHHDALEASGLRSDLDFVVQDGDTPGHKASTILRLTPARAVLVREGATELDALRDLLTPLGVVLESR